jgi:hypothetical protein
MYSWDSILEAVAKPQARYLVMLSAAKKSFTSSKRKVGNSCQHKRRG